MQDNLYPLPSSHSTKVESILKAFKYATLPEFKSTSLLSNLPHHNDFTYVDSLGRWFNFYLIDYGQIKFSNQLRTKKNLKNLSNIDIEKMKNGISYKISLLTKHGLQGYDFSYKEFKLLFFSWRNINEKEVGITQKLLNIRKSELGRLVLYQNGKTFMPCISNIEYYINNNIYYCDSFNFNYSM